MCPPKQSRWKFRNAFESHTYQQPKLVAALRVGRFPLSKQVEGSMVESFKAESGKKYAETAKYIGVNSNYLLKKLTKSWAVSQYNTFSWSSASNIILNSDNDIKNMNCTCLKFRQSSLTIFKSKEWQHFHKKALFSTLIDVEGKQLWTNCPDFFTKLTI